MLLLQSQNKIYPPIFFPSCMSKNFFKILSPYILHFKKERIFRNTDRQHRKIYSFAVQFDPNQYIINPNMQILQWLFKIADEHPQEPNSSHATLKQGVCHDEKVRSTDIVVFNNQGASKRYRKRVEQGKLKRNNLKLFCIFRRKHIAAKACFYHSLNLKRLGSFRRRQHSTHPMKMKKHDIATGLGITHNTDSSALGGNKVLPITDTTKLSSSNNNNIRSNNEKKEKLNGDKIKKFSRMKELLKWAANSKSEKGGNYITRKVMQFRNRGGIKAKLTDDDDQLVNESPKFSLRWDLESFSTTTSSAISMASLKQEQPLNVISLTSTPLTIVDQSGKTGNWITTDSEFVVLEL